MPSDTGFQSSGFVRTFTLQTLAPVFVLVKLTFTLPTARGSPFCVRHVKYPFASCAICAFTKLYVPRPVPLQFEPKGIFELPVHLNVAVLLLRSASLENPPIHTVKSRLPCGVVSNGFALQSTASTLFGYKNSVKARKIERKTTLLILLVSQSRREKGRS